LPSSGAQVDSGFEALYGYAPVAAALHAGRRGVETLYIQEGGALSPRHPCRAGKGLDWVYRTITWSSDK
jgi:hypothetical protein